ncbi:ankyrin repeat-containing domain protein [Ilyonectria destructans]|nr:ankyrin repeat-containing domain protein [Ilyonectria destructans]
MKNKDNAAKARVAFDSVLLSSRAVQRTVVQSNWSLFLGILELCPPLTDEELKPALELAACTRRTEFVLAMLILDREHDNISRETLRHILCQACRPRQADFATNTIFPRYYLGLQPEFIQSIKTPQDIAYGWLIAEMVLHSVVTRPKSKIGDLRSFMEKPLFQAVVFNRMPLARWFISDWGADPVRQNKDGETILSLMAWRNSFHAVKYILELPGASKMIENRSFLGEGPIHLAAAEGNSRIIKMLFDAGASPTGRKFLDQTVLHLCASLVNKGAFCTLVDHIKQLSPSTLRAMMNQKDSNGATPLHLFLQGSDPKPGTTCRPTSSQDRNMERILSSKILKYVDNINTADEWGLTPMHYLVLFNEDMPKTATLLCRRGADPLRQSSHIGASPLQLLRQRSKLASCMALLTFVVSNPAMRVVFLRQARADADVDFEKVGRVLMDRLQIIRQREAKMREQLHTEFKAQQ